MNCSNCGKELKDHWKQCPWCKASTEQTLKCQTCGEELQEGMLLCPGCGVELQTADKTDFDKYFDQGCDQYGNDQNLEAINSFTEALKYDPSFFGCYALRGLCYKELHNFKKAIDDFTKAIELAPSDALAYENRCRTLSLMALEQEDFDMDMLERALADAKKAYKLEPNEDRRELIDKLVKIINDQRSTGGGILRGIGAFLGGAAVGVLSALADDDDDD